MAARRSHCYLGGHDRLSSAALGDQFDLEFDEAEVLCAEDAINIAETKKPVSNPRPLRKPVRKSVNVDHLRVGPRSLPVNIPDWSQILRGEYRKHAGELTDVDYGDEEEDDGGNDRIPPHEYLARTRVASLSVHEGVGRTLKGRDLSRVRNAIWKQTGFED
ncbi:uncharacterized protein LOC105174308 [Sesamum indicum]|uniref:Uncharacterized protein LOC105174308 n=1 Tax=Sesamum indicum TaxID=4182 RepID=A0A6I9UAA6_SESIN|nr:uncharacterized protein LOC105174308 [Sesamum indicum]